MPSPAENLHAFDLCILKALVNFKINGDYKSELHNAQKENLCIKFNKNDGGIINLNADYFNKIWQKGKEIPHNVTLNTLNELCKLLNKNYSWYSFLDNVLKFRPSGIPFEVPYTLLVPNQQEDINKAIKQIIIKYNSYEEFEKCELNDNVKKNKEIPSSENNNEENQKVITFINRIYIELSTRKATIPIDENNDLIVEIYDSWYKLFCSIRDEMKQLPIKYSGDKGLHSSILKLAHEILSKILRPHLTEHQAKFRNWFQNAKQNPKNKNITPQELQKKYPNFKIIIQSMKKVNNELTDTAKKFHEFIK